MSDVTAPMPPGTDTSEQVMPGGAIRFSPSRVLRPDASLFDPLNPALDAVPVTVGGRQSAWFVSGPFGKAVLRHYRRGGLIARLSHDRYIWTGARRTRPFAEYELLVYMRQRALPVPRPLAAAYWRTGLFYRAALLISLIPNARTLARSLDNERHAAVAEAIMAMHNADVWHADLNAYNILFDSDGHVWLIDFDRSRQRSMTARRRKANLMRLRRSLIKVAAERGEAYWQQINSAYQGLLKRKVGN